MAVVHTTSRNTKRTCRLLVLYLTAAMSPVFALPQEDATGPRRRIFDEFMNFNQLVRNAAVRPIWSAVDDSFRFAENGVLLRIDPHKNAREIDNNAPPSGPAVDRNKISSPDGKHFFERRNYNLFMGRSIGDEPEALTKDGTPDYSWAAAQVGMVSGWIQSHPATQRSAESPSNSTGRFHQGPGDRRVGPLRQGGRRC